MNLSGETTSAAGDYVQLGRSGIMISPLGIGAWAWGDTLFWGYGRDSYTDDDLRAGFTTALDAGINLVDTAEAYGRGRSEILVGRFVRPETRPVVVATKFFPYPWRLRPADLSRALAASVQRLGLKQIDLYQMHWPFPPVAIERWMDAMAAAVEAGVIRAVGVSNYNLEQTQRAQAALERRGLALASNQVHFSLLQRAPERSGLLAYCQQQQITVIAYSPLEKGMLTGKYTPANPPPGVRRAMYGRRLHALAPLIERLRAVGQAHGGKTPGQVALNWVMSKGAVPIPGAKNVRQAHENAGALGWRLNADEVTALDTAAHGL